MSKNEDLGELRLIFLRFTVQPTLLYWEYKSFQSANFTRCTLTTKILHAT